jgi:hypothetical protein
MPGAASLAYRHEWVATENPLASFLGHPFAALVNYAPLRNTRSWIARVFAGAVFLFNGVLHAWSGFDVGESASIAWEKIIRPMDFPVSPGTWLRIRNLTQATEPAAVKREKTALRELRRRGFQICVLVEWPKETWKHGVRPGHGGRATVAAIRSICAKRGNGRATWAGRTERMSTCGRSGTSRTCPF